MDVISGGTNDMVREINIKLNKHDLCVMLNIKIMSGHVLELVTRALKCELVLENLGFS